MGQITETLSVDRIAGSFSWTRSSGSSLDLKSNMLGGRWCVDDVAGVRFTTKVGDPSREHLTLAQRQLLRKIAVMNWIRDSAIELIHGFLVVVNPLTFLLALLLLLTGCLWDVFPRLDGKYFTQTRSFRTGYNMMAPPDEAALDWSTCVAFSAFFVAGCALWWFDVVPIPKRCREAIRRVDKLPNSICRKVYFSHLRPLNGAVLGFILIWCFSVVVICPLAKARSSVENCTPISEEGRRLTLVDDPGEKLCYQQPGVKLRCGVGNCTCGWRSDLACTIPPARPKEVCQTLHRPLCAPDNSSVETNGYHVHLLVLAIGSAVLSALEGLLAIANCVTMFQEWFPAGGVKARDAVANEARVDLRYHRFTVSFALPEKNLEFNMMGEDDPNKIVLLLLGSMPKQAAALAVEPPPPPMAPPVGIVRVHAGSLGDHDVPMQCEPVTDLGSSGIAPTILQAAMASLPGSAPPEKEEDEDEELMLMPQEC